MQTTPNVAQGQAALQPVGALSLPASLNPEAHPELVALATAYNAGIVHLNGAAPAAWIASILDVIPAAFEKSVLLEQSFDIYAAADRRGIEMWQAEQPKTRAFIWPDKGKLAAWLLERLDRADALLAELQVAFDQRATELLEANNAEVERRRVAERRAQDLERRLAKEEEAHLRTIDDRDEAEAAFTTAFYMACGRHPEWSNHFDFPEALDELREHVAGLKLAEEVVSTADNPQDREGHHASWAVLLIFGFALHALSGDMLATGIMLVFALWHLIQATRWSTKASAVEVIHG